MTNRAPGYAFWTTIALVFLTTLQSKAGVDFLIVEHVDRLKIYNKYQQEASAKDRQALPPFAPMKILKTNDMLGDGFTPCMQVEIEGQVFYLLKENEAALSHGSSLGFLKTFRNATLLLDTLRLLNRSVTFSPINSSARQLPANEKVLRVFRHGNATYCRVPGSQPEYGWISFRSFKKGRDWDEITKPVSAGASLNSSVISRVRARVQEANRVLVHLSVFFNRQTSQERPIPRWDIETTKKTLLCTLRGTTAGKSEESTFYLVNDIENIVLGSAFHVTHVPGRIEIRQK